MFIHKCAFLRPVFFCSCGQKNLVHKKSRILVFLFTCRFSSGRYCCTRTGRTTSCSLLPFDLFCQTSVMLGSPLYRAALVSLALTTFYIFSPSYLRMRTLGQDLMVQEQARQWPRLV